MWGQITTWSSSFFLNSQQHCITYWISHSHRSLAMYDRSDRLLLDSCWLLLSGSVKTPKLKIIILSKILHLASLISLRNWVLQRALLLIKKKPLGWKGLVKDCLTLTFRNLVQGHCAHFTQGHSMVKAWTGLYIWERRKC